uniref:Uncharacterized protein n=1 Tax=Psychrobacter sp. (strain PRwf-1) TaxID=349106 RepID=A5WBS9_PSYWF
MTQSNDNKFEQQQSDAELAGLKNQVEGNLGENKDKSEEQAAEGIADNLAADNLAQGNDK